MFSSGLIRDRRLGRRDYLAGDKRPECVDKAYSEFLALWPNIPVKRD
jgi:hypothetical protein